MCRKPENADQLVQMLAELYGMNDHEQVELDQIYDKCVQTKEQRDLYYLAMDNCAGSFNVTDGAGKILFVNKTFEEKCNCTKDEIIGKTLEDMEKSELYRPSAALIAIHEKKKLTMIQGGVGGNAIVTATPLCDSSGSPYMCVSNARFFDEINILASYFDEMGKEQSSDYVDYDSKQIAYADETVLALYRFAKQIATTDSSIMITGETGTGKTMLAKFIHENSNRSDGKFVHVNCAAIPENLIESELFGYESGAFTDAKKGGKPGMFELASGGTLFLDEIGDMPLSLQPKILASLQEKKVIRLGGIEEISVDVRIISATNKNLGNMMNDGLFRSDLYYRLNVVPLYMPALRERKADITAMIHSFISLYSHKYDRNVSITDSALDMLNHYQWPGNIRELENMIERLVITNRTGIISENDLPDNIKIITENSYQDIVVNRLVPLNEAMEQVEKKLVEMAYKNGTSTYKAARILGISQSSASRKYIKYIKGISE